MTAAPAPKPCASCPYRRDVPSGVWAAAEYDLLERYDGELWEQPEGLFQCHQNDRGSDRAQLCAGWVACHGPRELLGVLLAAATARMTPDEVVKTLDYHTDVPVFSSGLEAAEHGRRDIDYPSDEAIEMCAKIARRRKDVTFG